jgi:hypothetical protein
MGNISSKVYSMFSMFSPRRVNSETDKCNDKIYKVRVSRVEKKKKIATKTVSKESSPVKGPHKIDIYLKKIAINIIEADFLIKNELLRFYKTGINNVGYSFHQQMPHLRYLYSETKQAITDKNNFSLRHNVISQLPEFDIDSKFDEYKINKGLHLAAQAEKILDLLGVSLCYTYNRRNINRGQLSMAYCLRDLLTKTNLFNTIEWMKSVN